jgi:hypothetical protein
MTPAAMAPTLPQQGCADSDLYSLGWCRAVSADAARAAIDETRPAVHRFFVHHSGTAGPGAATPAALETKVQ